MGIKKNIIPYLGDIKMYIGIDVGGTAIKAILLKDNDIIKYKRIPNITEKMETVLDQISKVIALITTESELKEVKAIGLSIAGQVNYKEGILINAPNMPIQNFNFHDFFMENYKKPSYIDNDVNCAAIAESSVFPIDTSQLFIFLGTGIGGAAVLNDKLIRGSSNLAMEIGHLTYKDNTLLCGCGKKGCYEAYAGAKNIIKIYKKAKSIDTKTEITVKDIENDYLNKEEPGYSIFKEALEALSVLTNDLITTLDPEYIVFGGGVIDHSDIILSHIKSYIKNKIRFSDFNNLKFKKSTFKDKSNAYGSIIGYIKGNNISRR
jgi:glucokinase